MSPSAIAQRERFDMAVNGDFFEALRPKDQVFSMTFKPEHLTNPETNKPYTQRELGKKLKADYHVRDALTRPEFADTPQSGVDRVDDE